jgi:hypothetical protein
MTKRVTMNVGRPYLDDKALARISIRIDPALAKQIKAEGRSAAAWIREAVEAAAMARYRAQ